MKVFQKNKAILVAIIIIILTGAYFLFEKIVYGYSSKDEEILQSEEILQKDEETKKVEKDNLNEVNSKEEEITKEKIYVYVTGEVNNSGVVILDEESRISDAIDAAGGITSKADISKINLVYVLEDGMKISIPSNEDIIENDKFQYVTLDYSDDSNSVITNSTTKDSSSFSISNNKKSTEKVNINSAMQTELETLPGIGPSLALKIISFRNENGKFSSIEDIKNVSGIADNKFDKIKDHITV